MSKITLKQCSYFQAIANKGSIAAAADIVGVSQPAIAQAITKLEDMTGLVLFRRMHARGMELTAQGKEFLCYADQLLTYADQMDVAVQDIAKHRMGTVRLGCFQSLAPFYLAQILSGYRAKMPGVVLNVREMLQEELTMALQRNELDLAILYDLGLDTQVFDLHPLTVAHPYLIVPQEHRLARLEAVSIHDINGENFILFDAPQSRDYFYAQFVQHGIKPRIAFRSASIETVRCCVANGLGISILSMRPASNQTYDGKKVVPIPLTEGFGPTRIVIASCLDREANALTTPLISFCRTLFQQQFKSEQQPSSNPI